MAMEMAYANLSTWCECAEPVGSGSWISDRDLLRPSTIRFIRPTHTRPIIPEPKLPSTTKHIIKLLKILTSTD